MDFYNGAAFSKWLTASIASSILAITIIEIYLRSKKLPLSGHSPIAIDAFSQRWLGRWWLLRLIAFAAMALFVMWPRPLPAAGLVPLAAAVALLVSTWRKVRDL
jgi:hypothetical protein